MATYEFEGELPEPRKIRRVERTRQAGSVNVLLGGPIHSPVPTSVCIRLWDFDGKPIAEATLDCADDVDGFIGTLIDARQRVWPEN